MGNIGGTISALNQQKLALEERKILVQEAKLQLEENRERKKLQVAWARAAGIVVPLIVVAVTVIVGLIKEREKEEADFEIKVAEIVMNTQSPDEAKTKAEAMKIIFHKRLDKDFANKFDAAAFTNPDYDPDYEAKLELFRMVLQNPKQKEKIVARWVRLFPKQATWANTLK